MDWNTYFSFAQKPVYQALFFLLITPVAILILRPANVDKAWVIALCTFVMFLIVNAAFIWFAERHWQYFFYSIGLAVGYVLLVSIFIPALIRLLRLEGSGESAMAFLVLMYQPFALLLVMFAKWIAVKWF